MPLPAEMMRSQNEDAPLQGRVTRNALLAGQGLRVLLEVLHRLGRDPRVAAAAWPRALDQLVAVLLAILVEPLVRADVREAVEARRVVDQALDDAPRLRRARAPGWRVGPDVLRVQRRVGVRREPLNLLGESELHVNGVLVHLFLVLLLGALAGGEDLADAHVARLVRIRVRVRVHVVVGSVRLGIVRTLKGYWRYWRCTVVTGHDRSRPEGRDHEKKA